MKSSLLPAQRALREYAQSGKASLFQRFFKTGTGEYGEGDVFLGVTVPQTRLVARKYADSSFEEIEVLLQSPMHEDRLLGLIILVTQFKHAKTEPLKKKIFELYLVFVRSGYVNNWDLVDTSAYHIAGAYVFDHPRNLLDRLAQSKQLWERRVAIVATYFFIQRGVAEPTFRIAKLLLRDRHDLIHKAVGWMLREVGKRCSEKELEGFLDLHAHEMPRTMLRYAIERFSPVRRQEYLGKGR